MERLKIYFTLDILSSGEALMGYVINSEQMRNKTQQVLEKLFPPELEFEIEEFDCSDVCNKIININNNYTLENIVRVYDDYRLRDWLVKEYSRSDLMKISNQIFPIAIPCNVTAADIIPPKTMNLDI